MVSAINPQAVSEAAEFEPLDLQLAELLAGGESTQVQQWIRQLSLQVRGGHVCLPLPEEVIGDFRRCVAVGVPGEDKPLVLDPGGRLYFHRYWQYETRLASRLVAQATALLPAPQRDWLEPRLNRYFPEAQGQRQAAATAAEKALCLISGGPGTGKTTSVAGLLAVLLEWRPELKIELAAPTGKAAARMQQALQQAVQRLPLPPAIRQLLPARAQTLHRLLGYRRHSVGFRHHSGNPLPADVVIVDEASMIDLALMAKLLDAVRPDARLILLGDKDQLASVEAGAVLAEICAAAAQPPLRDNFVLLDRSYRFASSGGLGQLAQAINAGQGDAALEILADPAIPEVELNEQGGLEETALAPLQKQMEPWQRGDDPETGLARFEQFQVLCVHRLGRYGVAGLNRQLQELLLARSPAPVWYPGRPVMILENHYSSGLYNGDIGICGVSENRLRVYFREDGETLRHFLPSRLPAHQTAYSLTVHKAQGSEFEEVLLVLPPADSPLLTRELLYTAVTRARDRVRLFGSKAAVVKAVATPTERHSGLGERLAGA